MCDVVDQAMRDGAVGVSSSLQYVPDMYNSTDELIAMAKVAARYGGAYFTHQRSEANAIDSSLDEVFRIAKEAGIRAQIWHLKTAYKRNWGRMPAVLERLRAARAEGIDVAANQYPYTAGSNGLDACLPPWIREGGRDALLKRLADPGAARAREEGDARGLRRVVEPVPRRRRPGPRADRLRRQRRRSRSTRARSIAQIAAEEKKDPRDALIDLVDRRPRQHGLHHLHDGRERRAHRAEEPARRVLHRLGRRRDGRHLLAGEVAPARLGLDGAHPRPLRPRREAAAASRRRCAR